ncbi:carbohydrate kinase family protein [Fervidobacterium thailandense]|uniref:carbohydrate kinase family protein n=1 Tax=Fervidobacterium thailandense TaxID=1008305 RepID=UPI0008FC6586|nr:carbohydrate kinase family protein [Fervidobacterium thailandense]
MEVCCIGKLNVDYVFPVEELKIGENHNSETLLVNLGGKATNVAVALSKLGVETCLIVPIGDDDVSTMVSRVMSHFHIDFRPVVKQGARTGMTFVVVEPNGTNTMFNHLGANSLLSVEDLKEFENIIKASKIVYFQTGLNIKILEYLLSLDVPVFVEASHRVELSILKYAFAVSLNESELLGLTSSGTLEDALRVLVSCGVKKIFLKVGERGSYYVENGVLVFKEAFKVDVVDTTGAGDAFSAGCIFGMLKGLPEGSILELANACGAITCTRFGTTLAFPTFDEVARFLENQRHQK